VFTVAAIALKRGVEHFPFQAEELSFSRESTRKHCDDVVEV
jgi:hypothetical protein